MELSPSILSADFSNLSRAIKDIENAGVKYVHIDVMDGKFVPNITMGQPVIKSLRKNTNLIFDVHLMIEEPIRYIKDFKDAGADIITVHQEACSHLNRTIQEIKSQGLMAGVSLNPATPIFMLEDILEYVDLVLIMSVNPGFGGQSFIKNSINKIKNLLDYRSENNLKFVIEVDGGINSLTINEVVNAGADIIVAGSAIFNDDNNVLENVQKLIKECDK